MAKKYIDKHEYTTLRELIETSAMKYGKENAFIIKHKFDNEITYEEITYKMFLDDINSFGTGLIVKGHKDKRIAII